MSLEDRKAEVFDLGAALGGLLGSLSERRFAGASDYDESSGRGI